MKKKLSEMLHRPKSIYIKVILLISVLILPLNLLAVVLSERVMTTTKEQAKDAEQAVINLYMADLATNMNEANYLLYYFMTSDPNCIVMSQQRDIDYQYAAAKMKFLATLKHMMSITDAADGYYFCMLKNEDQLLYGLSAEAKDVKSILDEQVLNHTDRNLEILRGWQLYVRGDIQYLVYIVESNNMRYGAWINLNEKKEEIYKEIEYQNVQLVFSKSPMLETSSDIICLAANAKNIYLSLLLSGEEILSGVEFYVKFIKMFALVYLILIPVLYLAIRMLLLNPLRIIGDAHKEIEMGRYDYRIGKISRTVEYNKVFKSFNRMADQLHCYRIEVYERKLEKQKMELRNLQLQIRPHFLLNTFNLIYTLTQQNDNEAIRSVILYLSDYFRYIFRSESELVIFTKELELIRGYTRIISIRYNGQIELDDDVDPELMFVRTPPLLIHNFVENAVKYGKKEGLVLHITLRAEYERGWVTFHILDDGNGMDEHTLKNNQEMFDGLREPEEKNAHLGLYNSYKRLKYFYGEEASIEVESEVGSMTLFTIRFPYNVEVDDESFAGK